MTMTLHFPTWRHRQNFWRCFVSLIKFSYWSKSHVNIITCSGVMKIFFYNGLTTNPEIRNTLLWVFSNIRRLGQVRHTKFGMNIFNNILLNMQNARVIGKTNQTRVKIETGWATRLVIPFYKLEMSFYVCAPYFSWEKLFIWSTKY